MTWLERIVKAFENIPEEDVKYSSLYDYFIQNDSEYLPNSWKNIIQRTIQDHSSDSKGFKNGLDLFSSVNGLGSGTWKLKSKISNNTPIAFDFYANEEHQPTKRIKTEVYRVIRDTKISKALKELYNHNCQICGKRIEANNFIYSEAHHIKPLGKPHNGPDSFDNIIVLCPNHHAEFDYGIIAIKDDFTIIHKMADNEFIYKPIILLKGHNINTDFLKYHMNEIYTKRNAITSYS